jgi:hypothetical protein
MSKMGSHHPFGHLKHKLWPNERSGVKLAVCLPTTKSQELPEFSCMQVVCDIPLEISWQKIQLCFRSHLNQSFAHKVRGAPKSRESQLWQFWDSHLGVLGQKVIWMWASWRSTKYTLKPRWWLPPSPGHGESCESKFASGSS